ncbi:hypothetical protein [Pseudomonas mucidolens]|uniref:Uncharacterized protein n=1 Tax=Pseudomonas mucidolens TaxID=46679 RepID=A0A1H2M4Y6_9PSED|nr:hypothetical protein [Pseudomonas mucidolens]SDU88184.1 hypothetical protein SAMN05216202_1022 [Pseudomonas mucidolens]SQH34541.1 L-asparaginase II [Pseudomonas mucidolens]
MSSNNQQVELPRVSLLATVGTIAGSADNRGTSAYNAGAIGPQQLMAAVSGLGILAQLLIASGVTEPSKAQAAFTNTH